MDTDMGICFLIHFVVSVSLKLSSCTQTVSKSSTATFLNTTCSFLYSIPKKVQLVKKSFPYLINVLWINVFNLLTTGDQISFQIGCSVEESVTIRASKGLDYCIDVAHVAYLTIVPQQPDSFPVVLDSPTSEFIFSFAIHNVYYMKGNFQVQKVLKNWKIFHRDPFQLREGES